MRATVIRGTAFITMEIPSGVVFILDTLSRTLQDKNGIVSVSSFTTTLNERSRSCYELAAAPILTDAVEIVLSDKTKWAVVLDQKVSVHTHAGTLFFSTSLRNHVRVL